MSVRDEKVGALFYISFLLTFITYHLQYFLSFWIVLL
jgi:hypothetical protein